MKILFTLHNIAYKGGGERVVANIANELCKIPNYQIEIMSYYTDTTSKNICAYYIDPRIKISYLHPFDDFHEKERGIKRFLWRLFRHIIINFRINRNYRGFDIIIESHLSMLYPRFKTKGTKYIKIMHMVINKWKSKNRFYDKIIFLNQRELQRWQPYSNNVMKISNFLPTLPFDELLQNILDSKNLKQISFTNEYNPYINIEAFKQAREMLRKHKTNNSNKKDYKTIVAIGRMDPIANHKGFPRLIDAYSKIAKDFKDWHLEIIGDDCGQKKDLETQINMLNMQDYIKLKPFTQDIESVYINADIFAMSSHSESLPMVLIEASSYGLPLIAYDIITIRDCFNNNGILVPDKDENKYCEALKELMNDEKKRYVMGKNGINFVKEKFSKDSIIKQWINLFESLNTN